MITLPYITISVLWFALITYAVFGGADFGAGIWDLLMFGPKAERVHELIDSSAGASVGNQSCMVSLSRCRPLLRISRGVSDDSRGSLFPVDACAIRVCATRLGLHLSHTRVAPYIHANLEPYIQLFQYHHTIFSGSLGCGGGKWQYTRYRAEIGGKFRLIVAHAVCSDDWCAFTGPVRDGCGHLPHS